MSPRASPPGAVPPPNRRIPVWYPVPLAVAALAVLAVLATAPHLSGLGRLVIYFVLIGAAGYLQGLPAGLAAAALSVLSAWYYLALSSRSSAPGGGSALTLGVFAAAAFGIAVWMGYARAGAGRRRETEATRALLAFVVETSDDAIFAKAIDGTILTWNAGAVRLYGYAPDEAIGRPVAMLVPPERAEEVAVLLDGLRRGESFRYETVRLRKDGGRVDVSLTVSPLRDAAGRMIGSSTVARDISERKRAEAQLREHGELLDLAYDAIFVWELEGGITFWNRGAEALYGYSRGEALGRVSHDLLQTVRPGGSEAFATALRQTGRWEGELRHLTKDGRELIVDSRHQVIERGGQCLVLEITRDITGRRRAEERRRLLAEASAALAKSLDVAATLEALMGVVVPALADLCGIHLMRGGAVVRRFVAATQDPDKAAVVREMQARYPFNPDSPHGAPAALRTGRSSLHPEITDDVLASTIAEPAMRDAVRRLGIRSAMFVPLVVRGRTLGAMTLVMLDSGRRYGGDDLAIAEDLASRAAFALDNALLHETEQAARREAERAADRVARLQKVTAALSGALTPQEVAEFILAQGVPALGAAAGAVYLLDAEGTSLEMISSVDYPETAERRRPVTRLSSATPMTQSVKDGRAVYLESADEAGRRYPTVRSSLHPSPGARAIVPTIVRGRPTGTLVFIFREPMQFAAADREFIESLAAQCAQALERSSLYAREHQVAATLQQALLPADLPYVPGVVIDAAHRAGSPGADVGGDWYDAFRLPDGRIVLAIGDVVGRGLEAAVTMGQIRQAVRAAALEGHPPAEILALVGRILPLAATGRDMTTAIVGVLDSLAGKFTYAAAGHPPPLLAAGGPVETLPSGGLPLGFMDQRPAPSWTVDLPPGALLVLYTDGLIESRRDATAGLAALCAAVGRQRTEGEPAPAHAILERLNVGDAPDDIALMAVARDPRPVERLELTVPAEPGSLPIIRHALQHVIRGLALDEQRAFALTVAVGEAVNNVIEHAYVVSPGSVSVRAWRDGSVLRVEVADQGRWRPARADNAGGRGLIVMRALVDSVEIETTATGTSVRLAVVLSDAPPHAAAPAQTVPPPAVVPAAAAAPVRTDGQSPPDGAGSDPQFPIRVAGGAAVVDVSGEVDMTTVEGFDRALERAAAQVYGPLIVSLVKAAYLDSRGVAALFHAATRLRTNRRALFLVAAPDSPIRGVLNAVEIAALCPVFASLDAALSAVSDPAT